MSPANVEQMRQTLAELAKQLNIPQENVYSMLYNQAVFEGYQAMFWSIFWLAVTITCGYLLYKGIKFNIKLYQKADNGSDSENAFGLTVIIIIFFMIVLWWPFDNFVDDLMKCIQVKVNTDWYVINNILANFIKK